MGEGEGKGGGKRKGLGEEKDPMFSCLELGKSAGFHTPCYDELPVFFRGKCVGSG